MIFSVYLHKNVSEILMCYGELSEVVNRILSLAEEGVIDIVDMPRCQPRVGATRYDIDITSEYYLSLAKTFPPNSSRISLRRLLYWFVESEVYDELGWTVKSQYDSDEKRRILRKLTTIKSDMAKLTRMLNMEEQVHANVISDYIENLEEMIKNGR